jgi:hypothetical protein
MDSRFAASVDKSAEGTTICGRYYRRSDKQRIAEAFKLGRLPEGFELPPDWNIAPSTNQPVIRSDPETGEREMVRKADLERPVHTLPVPDSHRWLLRMVAADR